MRPSQTRPLNEGVTFVHAYASSLAIECGRSSSFCGIGGVLRSRAFSVVVVPLAYPCPGRLHDWLRHQCETRRYDVQPGAYRSRSNSPPTFRRDFAGTTTHALRIDLARASWLRPHDWRGTEISDAVS